MKYSSAAALRNRQPITAELRKLVPQGARVLEIASGSGEHIVYFAAELPGSTFLPSDGSSEACASISQYVKESALPNIAAAQQLDVTEPNWAVPCDAIVCCNMIHIAPWPAAVSLMAGAQRSLAPGGLLILYGPYRFHGQFLANSNELFDADLRRRNSEWGVRDIDDVDTIAKDGGFTREQLIAMPANNHLVVYKGHLSEDPDSEIKRRNP